MPKFQIDYDVIETRTVKRRLIIEAENAEAAGDRAQELTELNDERGELLEEYADCEIYSHPTIELKKAI